MEKLNFRETDKKKCVKINMESTHDLGTIEPITVIELFNNVVNKFPDHPALKQKNPVTNDWESYTYREYQQRVEKLAKVFIKLGLERHGTVAVLAFNCIEWFISELASIFAGGNLCGIYTTNSILINQHILETSSANIVVVDDAKQMEKIHAIKDKLPHLKAVVQILPPYAQFVKKSDGYWRWSEIEDLDTSEYEEEYQRRLKSIKPAECCSLIYTSGTTGNPKGAMLSHDNFTFLTRSIREHLPMLGDRQEVIVSYLPLSHVASQALDLFVILSYGGTVYFADKDALKGSLMKTLVEAHPTIFLGVPRVYEKIQEKMLQVGAQSGALKKTIGGWAKNVTLQYHLDCMAGNYNSSLQYKIASKLVLSKVKHALGLDRCKLMVTGAAPMSDETKKYFMSLDMMIVEAYGMSESTGCHTVSRVHDPDYTSIGLTIPGLETKIFNPDANGHGEICMRGRNVFMGYLGEMEKTVEAIDDEYWLHTGDIGYIDKDGFVFITGRIKELVITAGGENIPPVHIENLIKAECSAISNVFLVGDKRKYLTVLVTLKTELDQDGAPLDTLASESLNFMEKLDLKYTKMSEIMAAGPDKTVSAAIQEAIDRSNKSSISNAQKVQKFAFLPHDFSIVTGELGPTMKLKRNFVAEKYKETINKLYT